MTEYEKLSLRLLLLIAEGISLKIHSGSIQVANWRRELNEVSKEVNGLRPQDTAKG